MSRYPLIEDDVEVAFRVPGDWIAPWEAAYMLSDELDSRLAIAELKP